MSLMRRLLNVRAGAIGSSRQLYDYLIGRGQETDSGAVVNPDTAMQVAAVYSCINVLAQDVSKVPLWVYRRDGNRRERAPDYWLYQLLQQPNRWQTGFRFRGMAQAHLELSGNFYAIKTMVRNEVRELLPIPPSRVTPKQLSNWDVIYEVAWPDGSTLTVPQAGMFHLAGLALNGVVGISPIAYQRESVGLAIQLARHGARMFRNGAQIAGVLQMDGRMSEDAAKRLKESFDEKFAGADNAHKVILLEEGAKYQKTGMSADDAQFLESRKFSRSEIAGLYRVPPHKIGDLDRATFSNIEQQEISYVTDALLPRFVGWESQIAFSLIPPADRTTYFAEHLVAGLLRGDSVARTNAFRTAVLSGWLNPNEVREMENMNPGPDQLNEYAWPPTSASAGQVTPNPANPQPATTPPPNIPRAEP